MKSSVVRYLAAVVLSLISACATQPAATRAQTAAACRDASTCPVSGNLEMSNDGHGYIGVLKLDDGSCINVSLPEKVSERLSGHAPERMTLTGRVLPFPHGEEILTFKVNGRRVGYGKCAPYYVFVE
jgi:hypothetical protein